MKRILKHVYTLLAELIAAPLVVVVAILARFRAKPIDVGLGPQPMINNVYHKQALTAYGYRAETFVENVYFITDEFDVRADQSFLGRHALLRPWLAVYLFGWAVRRYRCLYLYFNGGPLHARNHFLWRLEPWLYKLAGVKIVVMPYGGDVQDLTRTSNLLFKDAVAQDYPQFKLRRRRIAAQIDLWTRHADHVISGCDWVEYMPHWDTLMLGHFSIDTERWKPDADAPSPASGASGKLRILHAPNHRTIKGTSHFVRAVAELAQEGVPVELVILERVSNAEVKAVMRTVDVVADQLIIGWYAMFAIEAMALGKPVLCYLRPDFEQLYIEAGVVVKGEIPIVNCTIGNLKDVLRGLALNRERLDVIGQRSREFVLRYHSTQVVGRQFDQINRGLGLAPSQYPPGTS